MTNRDDPKGKKALFETPPVAEEHPLADDPLVGGDEPDGRKALFSAGARRAGTVVIDCAHCGIRSRVSVVEAVVRILAISFWLPAKRYGHWLQCPSCQRRSWVHIHWMG